MKRLIGLLALAIGCSNAAAPPKLAAGAGIKIDEGTQTVSVDAAKVPMLPDCGPQQIVQRAAGGQWVCASSAPNADKLGAKPADDYALKSGTVANAEQLGGKPAAGYALLGSTVANASALEGHGAADFLGASATAANSARLGGFLPVDFLAANGKAADSAKLDGHSASEFLGAKATAADSAKLGGRLPADFLAANGKAVDSAKVGGIAPERLVLQDPTTHQIDLQGDIEAGDGRMVVSNEFCLVSDPRDRICLRKGVANTSLDGLFCGATSTTSGNFDGVTEPETTLKVTGYRAAKLLCEKATGCSARAHMCTASELARSESLRVTIVASAWYANGVQDCARWSTSTGQGAVWNAYKGSGETLCTSPLAIACCE
jgi:hypothetical protein